VARERLDALADAGRRFELTTDFSYSNFNNDFDNWHEGSVALAWRIDDSRQLTTGIAIADRFDLTDVQVGLGWNARFDDVSGYLLGAAVAPGADFLPTWLLRGGYDRELYDLGNREIGLGLDLGVGIGFFEGSLAQYEDGLVQGFEAGIVQYALEGSTWLTAKAGGSFGTDSDFDPSYGLRLDLQATTDTRFFLGFGHAFDNSDQGTGSTQSYFGGIDHMLTDRLGLIATVALEDRENGVRRTTFTLGMRVRF
jgi:YaiO family outer membrane protein